MRSEHGLSFRPTHLRKVPFDGDFYAHGVQSEAERLLAGARDLEESIGVSLSARRFEVGLQYLHYSAILRGWPGDW